MIRFIDLGKQIGPGAGVDEDWPRQFAFFNTVDDRFIELGYEQVFESAEEVKTLHGIKSSGYPLDRLLSFIHPNWPKETWPDE